MQILESSNLYEYSRSPISNIYHYSVIKYKFRIYDIARVSRFPKTLRK